MWRMGVEWIELTRTLEYFERDSPSPSCHVLSDMLNTLLRTPDRAPAGYLPVAAYDDSFLRTVPCSFRA